MKQSAALNLEEQLDTKLKLQTKQKPEIRLEKTGFKTSKTKARSMLVLQLGDTQTLELTLRNETNI